MTRDTTVPRARERQMDRGVENVRCGVAYKHWEMGEEKAEADSHQNPGKSQNLESMYLDLLFFPNQ